MKGEDIYFYVEMVREGRHTSARQLVDEILL